MCLRVPCQHCHWSACFQSLLSAWVSCDLWYLCMVVLSNWDERRGLIKYLGALTIHCLYTGTALTHLPLVVFCHGTRQSYLSTCCRRSKRLLVEQRHWRLRKTRLMTWFGRLLLRMTLKSPTSWLTFSRASLLWRLQVAPSLMSRLEKTNLLEGNYLSLFGQWWNL